MSAHQVHQEQAGGPPLWAPHSRALTQPTVHPGHLSNCKGMQLTRSTRKRRASSLSRSAGSLTFSASSSPAHIEMRRKGGVKSMSTACGARWEEAGAAVVGCADGDAAEGRREVNVHRLQAGEGVKGLGVTRGLLGTWRGAGRWQMGSMEAEGAVRDLHAPCSLPH